MRLAPPCQLQSLLRSYPKVAYIKVFVRDVLSAQLVQHRCQFVHQHSSLESTPLLLQPPLLLDYLFQRTQHFFRL